MDANIPNIYNSLSGSAKRGSAVRKIAAGVGDQSCSLSSKTRTAVVHGARGRWPEPSYEWV